jgi:flagellar protein FliL
MKKLLPVILAILGLTLGTGAGIALKPKPEETANDASSGSTGEMKLGNPEDVARQEAEQPQRRSAKEDKGLEAGFEYVKLNNQFIVPVVSGSKVAALVVMSLSVEVPVGQKETVFTREPKLRDAFLQVLFDHANSGGFDGVFTTGEKMDDLRGSLFEAATSVLGSAASDVLIIDIVRQDV